MKHIAHLLLLVVLSIEYASCLQYELSVQIEPGKRECFHQHLAKELTMELDFQVIQGGELDISLTVASPSQRILVIDHKKQGAQHQFKTEEDGEHVICFDNTFSTFANKQVYFFLVSLDPYTDPNFISTSVYDHPAVRDQLGDLDMKVENFQASFQKVNENLEKAQRFQHFFKASEMLDRTLMEHNFERVNFWSVVNICLMVSVGFVQVYMIRSLFEDRSKIGKILRGGVSSSSK